MKVPRRKFCLFATVFPATLAALLLAGCAARSVAPGRSDSQGAALDAAGVLERLSWGATPSEFAAIERQGTAQWIAAQLRSPSARTLPLAVQEQIDGMTIEQRPMADLVVAMEAQRRAAEDIADEDARKAAQQDFQREMNRLAREAAARSLLRDLYSSAQLQEQMAWFWFNHFNVHQHKHLVRAMVGDYEERLRMDSLGKFRTLLTDSALHPAMLSYLDNAQNADRHINENFARELLELHTLGVDGGYTQHDVQELARVLTGFGVNTNDPNRSPPPKIRKDRSAQYLRRGIFEFNPNRHDYGDKILLGHIVRGTGPDEIEQVLDLLARHPATAQNVCRKLARFLVADEPPAALVDAMSREYLRSDGEISAVLRVALASDAFAQSLHKKFKDPMHFVVSAVRLAYDRKPIVNAAPMVNWLTRLGEAPFNHPAPDGYALIESAWDGPGQMALRFEIAKAIGSGSAGLFRAEAPEATEMPAFPQLANALYYESMQPREAPATRQALEQAASPQEWNLLLLSSPEFMLH